MQKNLKKPIHRTLLTYVSTCIENIGTHGSLYSSSKFNENPQDLNIKKNSKAHQDTVSAKAGSVVDANVHTCCGDFGSLSVSIGDEVKVSSDGHVKISNERHANHIGGCNGEDCVQTWQLPKIKKGSYNLVYYVSGETEVNEIHNEDKDFWRHY